MDEHRKFLERCRELAWRAGQSGNTPVGAIIVRDGEIVGEGMEATRPDNDITRHAEVEAIRDALKRLRTDRLTGCAMYTTHEPCILCSYAIRHYQISWVGFEHSVPAVGGVNSSWPILTAADVPVWTIPPTIMTFEVPDNGDAVSGSDKAQCRSESDSNQAS